MSPRRTVYRPILLTKDGELGALRDLDRDVAQQIAPILVVHPVRLEDGHATKSVEQHVDDLARKILQRVPGDTVALDTSLVDDSDDLTAPHPTIRVADQVEAASGVRLIPVVTRGRSSTQVTAAAELHRRDGRGACVRLPAHDTAVFRNATETLPDLLDDLGAEPEEIDIVLDMATDLDAGEASRLVTAAMPAEGDEGEWRSVTLAASSFPKDLEGLPKNQVTRLPRDDWRLWSDIAARLRSAGLETPDYGDYGIAGPRPWSGVGGPVMSMSAAIRYAVADDWLVAKGELFIGPDAQGGAAVPPVAGMLTGAARLRAHAVVESTRGQQVERLRAP